MATRGERLDAADTSRSVRKIDPASSVEGTARAAISTSCSLALRRHRVARRGRRAELEAARLRQKPAALVVDREIADHSVVERRPPVATDTVPASGTDPKPAFSFRPSHQDEF